MTPSAVIWLHLNKLLQRRMFQIKWNFSMSVSHNITRNYNSSMWNSILNWWMSHSICNHVVFKIMQANMGVGILVGHKFWTRPCAWIKMTALVLWTHLLWMISGPILRKIAISALMLSSNSHLYSLTILRPCNLWLKRILATLLVKTKSKKNLNYRQRTWCQQNSGPRVNYKILQKNTN